MNYYEKELLALKRSARYRTREIIDEEVVDFGSNDYLGLAERGKLHQEACKRLEPYKSHAPKASLLVGGYHPVHQAFETALCKRNGFEAGVVVGSGFNANIALIEALVRKNDILLIDAAYHASGMLAANIGGIEKAVFAHNDMEALEALLKKHHDKKRRIVAVEGIYSMEGDMVPYEVFELCEKYDAILIVDEAHSSGVVGERLNGVYDHYNVKIAPNHIKMGTLGKAYGSFGAYILASEHIVTYLLNRAKPLIYATAPSLYDVALAHASLEYIQSERANLRAQIKRRQAIVKRFFGYETAGLILPIAVGENEKVLRIKERLLQEGYFIGAIRTPTVPKAILRIIARLGESENAFVRLLERIQREL